jgi:hypothetical protein
MYHSLFTSLCVHHVGINGIKKYEFGVASNSIISIPNLIRIHPRVLALKHADGQRDTTSSTCVHVVNIVERTHNVEILQTNI